MFSVIKRGTVNILSGNDPLNVDHVRQVATLLEECVSSGPPRVVVDLQNVPLIDSSGLELLWDWRDRCLQRGGALELAAPSPLCRDIFVATELAEHFVLFDDALAAVGSFAQ